jgi:hypothetical protein
MKKLTLGSVCAFALALAATGAPLKAQGDTTGKPPVFTYIAQWVVPRDQWPEMVKLNEQEKPVMDKLVADGTLLDYGYYSTLIHQVDMPTHGSWFAATSEGKLMKALEAIYAAGFPAAPVEAASKHWDELLVSTVHNGRSGDFDGAYLSGSNWQVKPGQEEAFESLTKSKIVPIFDKLVADGSVIFYSMDTEDYHTSTPGAVDFVFATPDAASLDKVDDALMAVLANDPALGPALRALTDFDAHRDFLLRVSHMSAK